MGARAYNIDYSGSKRPTTVGAQGSGRGSGVGKTASDAAAESSRKRTTAVDMKGSSRSPAYPTETNKGLGGGRQNGVGKLAPPKTKSAASMGRGGGAAMPEKPSPMGGLPGKGGPNRSAGVPRAKHFVKSEGF